MKSVLWLLFLCTILFFSLGNTIIPVISMTKQSPKYKSPTDYYSDANASQGVFSKTIEPMANEDTQRGTKLTSLIDNISNGKANNAYGSKDTQRGTKLTSLIDNISNGKANNAYGSKVLPVITTIKGLSVGGCNGTQYGCCPDNVTAKNVDGSNCAVYPPVNVGCAGTPFGCCPDNVTAKNAMGNCSTAPINMGCENSPYGCCPDKITSKNAAGNNCSTIICANSPYGCCNDNVTAKNVDGSNCSAYPPVNVGCAGTIYGCCPDNVTAKNANGSNCAAYPPVNVGCTGTQFGCCPDNVTVKNVDGSNCSVQPQANVGCAGTIYGCCPDNVTAKDANGNCPVSNPYATLTNQSVNSSSQSIVPYNTNTVFIPPPIGTASGNTMKCPDPEPCPPCGRCPEPSFDCKKVPNYSSTNSEYLPIPVLNDFSQFGM